MNNWISSIAGIELWKRYSQCNEEAYIAHFLSKIPEKFKTKFLVDLGAGDGFSLSNSRYFLEQGYKGILIDGNNHGRHDVHEHFITKENICDLLKQYECPESFDLLSIDLDGNDLYIMEAILQQYKPLLIVAEFNPIHEAEKSVAIQYDPNHTWGDDDYYGFSFAAGQKMAHKNGYTVFFQNDNLNMYFMRNDALIESLELGHDEEMTIEVPYEITHGHKASTKQTWVEY